MEVIAYCRKIHLQGSGYFHRDKQVLSPHRDRSRGNASRTRFCRALSPNSRSRQEFHPGSLLERRSSLSCRLCRCHQPIRGARLLLLASIDHIVTTLKRQDIQFVVAGAGPELEVVKQACEKMDLTEYVSLTGRIDDAKLLTMLSTADVCVNPDRVTAMNDISTMNKVMEYMALGKPIVQFDVKEGRVSAQDASLYAKANEPSISQIKFLSSSMIGKAANPYGRIWPQARGGNSSPGTTSNRSCCTPMRCWLNSAERALDFYRVFHRLQEAFQSGHPGVCV